MMLSLATMRDRVCLAIVVLVISLLVADNLRLRLSSSHDTPDVGGDGATGVLQEGSSVWCREEVTGARLCHFHNLCHLPVAGFVFVHGDRSVVSGVPVDQFPLLELLSVANHSAYHFSYTDLPMSAAAELLRDSEQVNTTAILFAQFHPGNLMHVIHDDLIPLYHTLSNVAPRPASLAPYDVHLVFPHKKTADQFQFLYDLFSSFAPLYLHNMSRAVCFGDIHVGVSRETTWYDYGFWRPQGPIQGSVANGAHVRRFAQFVTSRLLLAVPPSAGGGGDFAAGVVLLSREHNRLILNEAELSVAMATQLGLRITRVSLETHSIAQIVSVIQSARLAVGVHGSLLSLAVFLPPGAGLVELYPFAVPPDSYTPYRTLAHLPGMRLSYRAWANTDALRSRSHPDSPPHLGGIAHLPTHVQSSIMSSHRVEPHLCCEDPAWLYRIYQDTFVDVDRIVGLMREVMADEGTPLQQDLYPAPLSHLLCENGTNISISWQPSWNLPYLTVSHVVYEVWTQVVGQDEYSAFQTRHTSLSLKNVLDVDTLYKIWVRCVINYKLHGPFTDSVICNTYQSDAQS